MDELLYTQIGKINDKIDKWVSAWKLIHLFRSNIHSHVNIDETEISIKEYPVEAIVLGELNDYSGGRNDYDALLSFIMPYTKNIPTWI